MNNRSPKKTLQSSEKDNETKYFSTTYQKTDMKPASLIVKN